MHAFEDMLGSHVWCEHVAEEAVEEIAVHPNAPDDVLVVEPGKRMNGSGEDDMGSFTGDGEAFFVGEDEPDGVGVRGFEGISMF